MLPDRCYETMSAMQKCVRRGQELEAGRFFFEMAEAGPGFFSVAVNRLRIVAYEDVGLGDPAAVMFAETALTRASAWHKGKKGAWRLAAANAILALCRAKKTRLADHFQAVCRGRNAENELEIPDFALDMHTRRGRALGRGLEHFRREGALLNRVAEAVSDPYGNEWYAYCNSGVLKRYETPETSCEEEADKPEKVAPPKLQEGSLFDYDEVR